MAYYCKECAEWIKPGETRMEYHQGNLEPHKYCDYDRAWRSSEQRVFNCGGFSYVRRAIVTKICEILGINSIELFAHFDEVKDNGLKTETFIDYNYVGPIIAEKMGEDPERVTLAKGLLEGFIIPAEARVKLGDYDNAIKIYRDMVDLLIFRYRAFLEEYHCSCQCKCLIKNEK